MALTRALLPPGRDGDALHVGVDTLSWPELYTQVERACGLLDSLALLPGDTLAITAERRPSLLALLLAAFDRGVAVAPLNPRATAAEVRFVLADAQIRRAWLSAAHAAAGDHTPLIDLDAQLSATRVAPLARAHTPDHPALLLYTSGTTGQPKGVFRRHRHLLATLRALHEAWAWRADDHLLHVLPLFHIHGLVVAQLGALLAGAQTTWLPSFDAAEVAQALASGRFSVFMGVPTFYHRLLQEAGLGALPALRLLTSGSAPLPAEAHTRFRERTGASIVERYGMTEAGIVISNPLDAPVAGSVGMPLPGVRLRIVHPDDGTDTPVGELGELWLAGPSIFDGYHARPDAQPFQDGWLRTGDLGRVDPTGRVWLLGRRSDMLLVGGFNVYPAEVEAALRQVPGVDEAVVVGLPDPDLGERPAAALIGAAIPSTEALRAACKATLSAYKVPRTFITLSCLPRTSTGKIRRDAVRQLILKHGSS